MQAEWKEADRTAYQQSVSIRGTGRIVVDRHRNRQHSLSSEKADVLAALQDAAFLVVERGVGHV
jgi:hypothetical protein